MTRATLPANFSGIYILTDKEFKEMKVRLRRERMMDELMAVSKKPEVRSYAKSAKPKEEPKKNEMTISGIAAEMLSGKDGVSGEEYIEQLMWDKYLPTEYESVDDIANDNIENYRFGGTIVEKSENDYSDMYKKEIAMVSSVLRDLNDIAKSATKQLAGYSKKGFNAGMSKTYADVLQATSATQKARLDAIKMISDLKAKQVDLTIKARKDQPNTELSVDDQVAQFYAEVMNGGMTNYVSNATGRYDYPPMEQQDNGIPFVDESHSDTTGNRPAFPGGFDLTRPLGNSETYTRDDSDTTGYISHEGQGVEVVVIKHDDGRFEFAAIDQDGNQVDDYELPGADLLQSLSIPPLSSVAYDKYSRRYRILDYGNPTIDISDN